jgi:hypothetical protein
MGLFSAGKTPRSPAQIKTDQRAAKIADANASTRPNTITVQELQGRSSR